LYLSPQAFIESTWLQADLDTARMRWAFPLRYGPKASVARVPSQTLKLETALPAA